MALTESQRSIITATVPILAEHGLEVTKHFYKHMIGENPSLRDIFSHSAQVTSRQPRALAESIYAYAAYFNDLTPILPVIERISHKHVSLNIEAWQYDLVGKYLLQSMRAVLGADVFTDEVRDAWLAAYQQLAELMIKKEEAIMAAHEKMAGGWRGWRDMKLVKKVRESSEITSFYWTPVDEKPLPTFEPGQYISIRLDVPELGCKQPRHYSLSSAPPTPDMSRQANGYTKHKPQISGHVNCYVNGTHSDPQTHVFANGCVNGIHHDSKQDLSNTFRISVKREAGISKSDAKITAHPGYVSNLLHDKIEVGDVAEVSHPTGDFYLELQKNPNTPTVLISGGVGITPVMSMLQTLLQQGDTRPISWIHVAKNKSVDAFAGDIKLITKQYNYVASKIYHSSPTQDEMAGVDFDQRGRLNLSQLDDDERRELLHADNSKTEYYVCGPDTFMVDISKGLVGFGVETARVHVELFSSGNS